MSGDGLDRRAFLQGGAAALGGAALALGGRAAWDAATASEPAVGPADAVGRAFVAARGVRQAGVGTPPQSFASFVSLDLVDGVDRAALVRLMRIWTDDIDRLTGGRPGLADTEPELAVVPARLTVTVGYGPGVFSAAGLDDRRPTWLAPLPPFAVDRLEDAWTGGDLMLQVCADDEVTISHAIRLMVKDARTFTSVRWVQRGFRRSPGATPPGTTMRNLMGQVDGTRNPSPDADGSLIWHESGPSWLVGGTSMVIRRIAMDLETWDAVDRTGREFALGRRLSDGSPLTGTSEHDAPDLDAVDSLGFPVIDTSAHIRRARSANPAERFLRRPYNYDDPPAPGTLSRSGLVFVTFQRDPVTQFVPIQRQLDKADMLNRWTTPIGSAVFAVPGGFQAGEYLGQRLLEV
ncbi:Dyp-type peroxidase [Cellulomonas sp. P24]|uniref:Dyp-type peroxidase n=1 Tax=Cellulomonas sp. P24 TaxID=2885206 RepID=UPI00216B42D0|nr:Dyp-type peroxidase [Cellulomonas sp. P24]MCR6490991.1 Dyp-type peroxidase [Cellulomonas sp. P24]